MKKRISGTYGLKVQDSWKQVTLDEIYLECDTSSAPVTINLFEIAELDGFWNVKIYVSDISDNAGTNNITINTGGSDEVDGDGYTSVVISDNGGAVALKVVSSFQWMASESITSVSTGYTEFKGLLNVTSGTPNTPSTTPITELVNTTGYTFQALRDGVGVYTIFLADEYLDLSKLYWNLPVMKGEETNITKIIARPLLTSFYGGNKTVLQIFTWSNADTLTDSVIDFGDGGYLPIEILIFP